MPKGLVSMDLRMDMEDTLVSKLAAFKYEFDVLRLAMVLFEFLYLFSSKNV